MNEDKVIEVEATEVPRKLKKLFLKIQHVNYVMVEALLKSLKLQMPELLNKHHAQI